MVVSMATGGFGVKETSGRCQCVRETGEAARRSRSVMWFSQLDLGSLARFPLHVHTAAERKKGWKGQQREGGTD